MRRISIIVSSIITLTVLTSCGEDGSVRVRAVDSPVVETPLATVVGATAAPAPVALPSAVPAVTAAPLEVPVPAETVAVTPPAAPVPETAPVTPPPVVVAAAPVVVAQAAPAVPAAPVADQPIDQNANAAAPAAVVTTTAYTSPPTTVIVKNEMPNVVCMTLQDAQNLIQKAGVFYSTSFDATGKGRKQLWDRGWIVVSQNIAPGTSFGSGDAKLGAVKKDEPNDC